MVARAIAKKLAKAPGSALRRAARPKIAAPKMAPDVSAVRQGISRILGKVHADRQLQKTADAAGLKLRPGMEGLFLPQPAGKAKGTLVFFHGYTAGPWQYGDLAARAHKAGYNVYVPRIPGHGFMDARTGMATGQRIVRSGQNHVYDRFVADVYRDASALGASVYVAGLSGGGNLALRMGERHGVQGVFAMAPFVGSNYPLRLVVNVMRFLNWATFGLVGRFLNRVPQNRNVLSSAQKLAHTQGSMGQVFAIRDIGITVRKIQPPVQLVTTHGDKLSGTWPVGSLFRRTGGAARGNGWFHFGKAQGVPHAMVSRQQNKAPGAVDRIEQMLFDFIEKGKVANFHP